MIKYSVIGTSWITKSFIEGAKAEKNLILDGVYSRSSEKGESFRSETEALRVFSSFEDLLNSDTDLVYVASPNSCHYAQCEALIKAKKHILCEKPITITQEEFSSLSSLAEKQGVIYLEAIMYMYSPAREVLKNALKEIGNIRTAHFDFSQLSSKYEALKRGELPNIFNPKMKTGALNDLGIYCVYPAVDLFGVPEKIIPHQQFLKTGADGSGEALFVYKDKTLTVTYSKVGQSRGISQIFGDEGTITIGSISQTDDINIIYKNGERKELVPDIPKEYHMGNEAKAVARLILNRDNEKIKELHTTCRKVLRCMEQMRVENA